MSKQGELCIRHGFPANLSPQTQLECVKIGAVKVPLSPFEFEALQNRLELHIAEHGVLFGFFAQILQCVPVIPADSDDV